jgi:hypothetical protein
VTLDGSEYVFSNEGNGSVSIDGAKKDDYPILYGDKYTIFGTADESCNGETVHQNYFGTTYTGDNNPTDYRGYDSYQFIPETSGDWGAYYHDRIYDIAGAKGPLDAALNTSPIVLAADIYLVGSNLKIMVNPQISPKERLVSTGISILFGTKVVFAIMR